MSMYKTWNFYPHEVRQDVNMQGESSSHRTHKLKDVTREHRQHISVSEKYGLLTMRIVHMWVCVYSWGSSRVLATYMYDSLCYQYTMRCRIVSQNMNVRTQFLICFWRAFPNEPTLSNCGPHLVYSFLGLFRKRRLFKPLRSYAMTAWVVFIRFKYSII